MLDPQATILSHVRPISGCGGSKCVRRRVRGPVGQEPAHNGARIRQQGAATVDELGWNQLRGDDDGDALAWPAPGVRSRKTSIHDRGSQGSLLAGSVLHVTRLTASALTVPDL